MEKSKMIINFAEDLNDMNDRRNVRNYYTDQAVKIHEDVYNRVVILLTMCVNKEMAIAFSEDDTVSVEEYPSRLKEIYSKVLEIFKSINSNIITILKISEDEKDSFLEYLNIMVECLLSGIKYIEKKEGATWNSCDEQNEWNTRYRREERIRDYMKRLISEKGKFTKFTIEKHIEIPYMYVLAWDLPKLFRRFTDQAITKDDTSYFGNLRKNTSIALKYISDDLLDILLHGEQTDRERFEESGPDEIIKFYKRVSYETLLPTITYGERIDYDHDLYDSKARIEARKNHRLPLVKKEVLRKIPLLPMEADKNIFNPIKSMDMMVGLMQEENKTKDYLESDIVYLKNCIVEICEKIIDWIWEGNTGFIRIDDDEAERYLRAVIKAVKNVPRKNSLENREDHIKKIINVLAKEWDEKQLMDIKVVDKNTETYVEYAYFSVLKLTRNWNEHNLLNQTGISFAVFIFMISIRYLLNINKLDIERHREYLFNEAKLFKFLGEEKINYENIDINELSREYKEMHNMVNNSAFVNGDKSWAKNFPKEGVVDPHQVLNVAGYKYSQINDKMSENEIFLTFWLSLHFGKAQNSAQTIGHTKDLNLIELLEYTYKYQKKSFLIAGLYK